MTPQSQTLPASGEGKGGEGRFEKALNAILEAGPLPLGPDSPYSTYLGKLGLKAEAAGKVRVFAMVDAWTQWLLHPLHALLFKILGRLPSDGTHDQLAPVNRLLERSHSRFWCYDLSAATDRLPVDLQAALLNYLFGNSFGFAWKNLLVGRDYQVPSSAKSYGSGFPESVRYAVGQPMGALSSWAMLALTHHFIVQWAAYRKGFAFGAFTEYAVLGDDIVIANGDVAGSYLQLMEALGVGIGIHKSLCSRKGVLEFAKRYLVRGVDCSPVPVKELVAALLDMDSTTQLIRKYELGVKSITAFMGYGYRTRGRLSATFDVLPGKLASLGIWRASPWGMLKLPTAVWARVNSFVLRNE